MKATFARRSATTRGRVARLSGWFGSAAVAVMLTGCASTSPGVGALMMVALFVFAASSCISGGETTEPDDGHVQGGDSGMGNGPGGGWSGTDGTCYVGTDCSVGGGPVGGGEGGMGGSISAGSGTGGSAAGGSGPGGSGNEAGQGGSGGSGYWGECCIDGVISDCYCPPNWECNFGMGGACGEGGNGGLGGAGASGGGLGGGGTTAQGGAP